MNEISFSYERMATNTEFENEAKGNLEMAYKTTLKLKDFSWARIQDSKGSSNADKKNLSKERTHHSDFQCRTCYRLQTAVLARGFIKC